jgi:hypothetical protein
MEADPATIELAEVITTRLGTLLLHNSDKTVRTGETRVMAGQSCCCMYADRG